MSYLYPDELSHQILFYALRYNWKYQNNIRTFAQDFICDLKAIDRDKVPQDLLNQVTSLAENVLENRQLVRQNLPHFSAQSEIVVDTL